MAEGGGRAGIRVVGVDASSVAEELGGPRLANLVLLGALVAHEGLVSLAAVERALGAHLPARHQHLLAANMRALRAGAACPLEPALV